MERLICLAVGYVCGLFQTGYLVGKELRHIDIRREAEIPGTTCSSCARMESGDPLFSEMF